MLESEAFENPVVSLDEIKRDKGEEETPYRKSLHTVEPAPKGIEKPSAGANI